ncbi:hypothetical protein CYMTET_32189, partial [Cymbomonas tetramitiformis]
MRLILLGAVLLSSQAQPAQARDDNSVSDLATGFSVHVISTLAKGAMSVYAADVNGDGDKDVLSASFWDYKIA